MTTNIIGKLSLLVTTLPKKSEILQVSMSKNSSLSKELS